MLSQGLPFSLVSFSAIGLHKPVSLNSSLSSSVSIETLPSLHPPPAILKATASHASPAIQSWQAWEEVMAVLCTFSFSLSKKGQTILPKTSTFSLHSEELEFCRQHVKADSSDRIWGFFGLVFRQGPAMMPRLTSNLYFSCLRLLTSYATTSGLQCGFLIPLQLEDAFDSSFAQSDLNTLLFSLCLPSTHLSLLPSTDLGQVDF